MKALSFIAFLLSLIASGDAAVGLCEGACVFNETMTCAAMIETMEFGGTCCSLADDPVTGNCVITISGGSCYWGERCLSGCSCISGNYGCREPHSTWFGGQGDAPCPASTYNVSGTDCTTPTGWDDFAAAECTENETMEPTAAIQESESMEPTPAIQESESMGPTAAIPENESMGPTAAPGTSAGVHTLRGRGFAIMSALFVTFALSSTISHRHV
jgi:hypothetical protein